jgi:hypothetical protein
VGCHQICMRKFVAIPLWPLIAGVRRTMEAFQTIAEIAVTLIGFVGIFLAFSAERARASKPELIDFLQSAIGATVFAFLPLILSGVVGEPTLWRIACGLFGLFHLAIWASSTRARSQLHTWVLWVHGTITVGKIERPPNTSLQRPLNSTYLGDTTNVVPKSTHQCLQLHTQQESRVALWRRSHIVSPAAAH